MGTDTDHHKSPDKSQVECHDDPQAQGPTHSLTFQSLAGSMSNFLTLIPNFIEQ
jgi:hypothetical protein